MTFATVTLFLATRGKPVKPTLAFPGASANAILAAAMAHVKDLLPLYRRLLMFVRPYRGRLIGGIVFGALYGPANVAVLAVVKRVWARFFEEGIGEMPGWQIVAVAMLLPAAMLCRGLCDFTGTYLMNWVGLRAVMDRSEER